MHRNSLIRSATAAVAMTAAGIAWGQDSLEVGDGKFTLTAPDTEQTELDQGQAGPSQGDVFVFSGPLVDRRGRTVGRLDGHCITISRPVRNDREQDRRQCFITSTFGTNDGETEIQAAGVGRILAEEVVFSVTGGTNRFRRVRGQAVFDYSKRNRTRITYDLILQP